MSEANSMDCRVGQSAPSESDRALWDAMGCIADDELCLQMLSAHISSAVAAERERICAAIKAADDKASEVDYMLDSDDCIKVARGEWHWPEQPNTKLKDGQ